MLLIMKMKNKTIIQLAFGRTASLIVYVVVSRSRGLAVKYIHHCHHVMRDEDTPQLRIEITLLNIVHLAVRYIYHRSSQI